MKKVLFYLGCLSTQLCNCQNINHMGNNYVNKLDSLYQTVQYQDSAIHYYANMQTGACSFEFLINDVPTFRHDAVYNTPQVPGGGGGGIGLSLDINDYILRAGEQTWELRIYPPFIRETQAYLDSIPKVVKIYLSVQKLRSTEDDMEECSDPVDLIQTPVKKVGDEEVFENAGQPYASYKGSFHADVPYNLIGWSKSKDLTKMDPKVLEKALVNEYELFAEQIKKGDLEHIVERIFKSETDRAQYSYYNKQASIDQAKVVKDGWEAKGHQVRPIENYKMTFWGNGKLVTLERVDTKYRWLSVLSSNYSQNERQFYRSYKLYFHIPEGSDKLEVIRYVVIFS